MVVRKAKKIDKPIKNQKKGDMVLRAMAIDKT